MERIFNQSTYFFNCNHIQFKSSNQLNNMSEEAYIIDKVDKLVRQSNMKYLQTKAKQQYEKQLHEYEKQRKKQQLKQYAQTIKEGNRKAILKKNEERKKAQKKEKKKKGLPTENIQFAANEPQNTKQAHAHKCKLTQQEKNQIEKGIQYRAHLYLKEIEMKKLDKDLQEQKKKTKLYELNKKCKKLLSKSIPKMDQIIPEQRRKILENYEEEALGEVQLIDQMIQNIIDKANGKKIKSSQNLRYIPYKKQESVPQQQQEPYSAQNSQYQSSSSDNEQDRELGQQQQIDIFNPQHPLFSKGEQQLLSLDYIPL